MYLFLWAEDSEALLRQELTEAFPGRAVETPHPLLLGCDLGPRGTGAAPFLAFARQWLPDARAVAAQSIREWAELLFQSLAGTLPDDRPWSLHVEPHYGPTDAGRIGARAWHSSRRWGDRGAAGVAGPPPPAGRVAAEAGRQRCRLIRDVLLDLLRSKRRHLLRGWRSEPAAFTPEDSLVQLLLTSPEAGFLSVALAPLPWELRHSLSPFPKGVVRVASDPAAPSRAFAKLAEAELRLGRPIRPGETCVDLGAAPGSWTYLAVHRGARVLAVDRSPLRADLMRHPRVRFEAGDAFRFEPSAPVDWLLCDVIAPPERSAELLARWLDRGWCRHFVVTLKLKDAGTGEVLARLKRELPPRTRELWLSRLCANKKEACALGSDLNI